MLTFLAAGQVMLVVAFTTRILLRDDLSPPARLAWFIVINIVPYGGSALYFLFGEVDIGHRASTRHRQILAEIDASLGPPPPDTGAEMQAIDPAYLPAFRYAASINGFRPMPGNRAELLANARATIDRMEEDIDAATDHVHVLTYIWLDDDSGTRIAEALIRAAGRGVMCRAMTDGHGSRRLIGSDLWKRMEAGGVRLAVSLPISNPFHTMMTSRLDMRNHRKITLIDGRITYCGSRNAADPEFRLKPRYAPWIDIMLRFEGPVVGQNALLFASDWMLATGDRFDTLPQVEITAGEGFPAVVIGDGPTGRRGATPHLFSGLIACARSHVMISTPYFVPDATLLEALCAAGHRGVEVTLIVPARNDSWIVAAASRSYYRRLLEAGCVIREYQGGLLHAKTFTMDGKICAIGSSNLDLRSFDLNYENNILLQDETITTEVLDRQQDYIASSEAITLEDVLAWSPPRRAWQNVVATVGPVL